ncbi:cupin domain-containing protein [Vibrio europaeus]|uniref:Cupin domain-containing protein n=1 Tax=Vibrio europaeus TaxID=300876 RepID=A0AAE7AWZ5_9VIBR|nr:cupin domain-containing protein [Vibrio europaeus]MDC5805579.1 cupin domain-containing protein [Vibrio europaeus]MDC5811116.1 cupin domain-containing protein [Vibrio europaeus]MDC5826347.1 cupin domain-containing protein [Vibrio europaeus]MDC5831712.1 cupin domain-containing protein [Vibrio europaeus]MDC5834667.1 cupin domain-containing protein [Vibrio europaeus]
MFEYTYYENLADTVDIPKAGITSRPVFKSDRLRAVIFGFAQDEEMSEHTAAVPAIAQIIEGECTFTLENEAKEMKAGAWVLMDAHLPHSIVALTPLKLMLYLLREPK